MKKAFILFAATVALVMVLSSCTPNGVPAGLIGEWKLDSGSFYIANITEFEITYNDEIKADIGGGKRTVGIIKKGTCNEITFLITPIPEKTYKYEVSCNDLALTDDENDRSGTFKRQ